MPIPPSGTGTVHVNAKTTEYYVSFIAKIAQLAMENCKINVCQIFTFCLHFFSNWLKDRIRFRSRIQNSRFMIGGSPGLPVACRHSQ